MDADVTWAKRAGWYFRRMQSMEKGEIPWRMGQVLLRNPYYGFRADEVLSNTVTPDWLAALESFRAACNRPVLLDRDRAALIAQGEPELVAGLIGAADLAANCRFQFFGYPAIALKLPINWHHDPIGDVSWPMLPSHRIDHRTAGGDVKWIWELNRLQHLPWLAQAWLFTGDDRYSRAAFSHLDTWIDQNPPGQGIAWRGAFEAGLRSISISVALQGLRDSPDLTVDRYRRIVTLLAQSQLLCWRQRSLFSSANNHLVGEMAGLAVTSMLFPELNSAAKYEGRALETLSIAANRQILEDGAGAEQSVGYQMATVELLHLVAALLIDRDGYAPQPICDAIARSGAFLSALVGAHDPDPRYGDSDQEFAVRLGPEIARDVRTHLAVIAPIVGEEHYGASDSNTLSARWFRVMADSTRHGSMLESPSRIDAADKSFFASDGGLVVLRSRRGRILMDVGQLGYLSIAAHGHADALSVTVSDDGVDLIGDPGTGSYYRYPAWRTVMRGTRAHATVCVDGQDQSVIGGPFLWSRHARTRVVGLNVNEGVVDAEHDGYARLPGRVIHRRWLVAPPEGGFQLVVDLVAGNGVHEVRTSWPLHPSLEAARRGAEHVVSRREQSVLRALHAATVPLRFDDKFGDEADGLGWWSDRLESRVPAWLLGTVCYSELPIVVATLITLPGDMDATDLAVSLRGGIIEATWMTGAALRSVVIDLDGSAAVTVC